jgi:DNA repair protein RecN (Recombination protein N)
MLALHQAILVRDESNGEGQSASARRTLIFDEVDAGVGGEAGEAIGVALAQLSLQYQVIVITHLPQVAAFADSHVVVSKETVGTETTARVETLTADQQVTELARMLAGKRDSDSARSHAVELLAGARETKGASNAAKTAKTAKTATSTKTANPAKKSKSQ